MSVHELRKVKRIPCLCTDDSLCGHHQNIADQQREDQKRNEFLRRHELSILDLLIQKHPERAREFLARLKNSMQVA